MRIAEVLRLRITGWTYQCLHMAARVEHELRIAAEKPRRSMTRAPSDDMVRLTAHDVHVPGKVAQPDRRSENLGPRTIYQRIVQQQFKKIRMELRGQIGRIGVPVQNIECRRLLAHQVVVDPVMPDQIVRSEPRERSLKRRRVQHTLL